MGKKTDSLIFKFATIFSIFTLLTLLTSGIATYFSQTNAYKKHCKEKATSICNYLNELLKNQGEEFVALQNYILENADKILIPLDFSGDWHPEKQKFEKLFVQNYPGKILGKDIAFDELDGVTQNAWATYQTEYWLNTFEEARRKFNVFYTYYVIPRGRDLHLYWMIDAVREGYKNSSEQTANMIDLTDDFFEEKLSSYPRMEEAWLTGRKPHDYDTFDNAYGKSIAYCSPFTLNGRVYGLIGVEIEVSSINEEIARRSVNLIIRTGIILIIAVFVTLFIIYRKYIAKLIYLQKGIHKYAIQKDSAIAIKIERNTQGKDEIANLSSQIASMMLELENYIKSLITTSQELTTTRQIAEEMNILATKDALTGIRNKTAYDREIKRIQWQIATGVKDFGIAMIDLNFLKRINDDYGHEQGNIAIKKLSKIICNVFSHSPVFRIGGDEFVVILKNQDYLNINELENKFNSILKELSDKENLEPWERVSAAIGIAIYNPLKDLSVESVFKRADKAMYANKKSMKAERD